MENLKTLGISLSKSLGLGSSSSFSTQFVAHQNRTLQQRASASSLARPWDTEGTCTGIVCVACWLYMHTRTNTHMHMYIHTNTQTHTCTRTYTRTHAHTHASVRTHKHTRTHAHVHTRTNTHAHVCMCACTHAENRQDLQREPRGGAHCVKRVPFEAGSSHPAAHFWHCHRPNPSK